MYYFKLIDGRVVDVSKQAPKYTGKAEVYEWIHRHHIRNFKHAEKIAKECTELNIAPGWQFLAVDSGPGVWPRFDVIKAPGVGELCSYGFNGDAYPDGTVVHVTPGTCRVVKTSTGNTYYRRKLTGTWLRAGGTWSLMQGYHNHRNPSF